MTMSTFNFGNADNLVVNDIGGGNDILILGNGFDDRGGRLCYRL
jgi:hypothetical protein